MRRRYGRPSTARNCFAQSPIRDAATVYALRHGGAVLLGKTVTVCFAAAIRHALAIPFDTRRTPGGSSSGSAAAVAAGMIPTALGTHGRGSTIRPASFCGVFGLETDLWLDQPSRIVVGGAQPRPRRSIGRNLIGRFGRPRGTPRNMRRRPRLRASTARWSRRAPNGRCGSFGSTRPAGRSPMRPPRSNSKPCYAICKKPSPHLLTRDDPAIEAYEQVHANSSGCGRRSIGSRCVGRSSNIATTTSQNWRPGFWPALRKAREHLKSSTAPPSSSAVTPRDACGTDESL